jgi:hypothetical protein
VGGLRDLWEAPVCPPRQRNRRLDVGADSTGDESPEEAARRLMDQRAVRLVHFGEVGRARGVLGRDGVLGVMRPADVEHIGPLGEGQRAQAGSGGLRYTGYATYRIGCCSSVFRYW